MKNMIKHIAIIIRRFLCSVSTESVEKVKHYPKIVVLSNRLPFVIAKEPDGNLVRRPSVGGLVTAVAPVIIASNGFWIGWPGPKFSSHLKIPESQPTDSSPTAGLKSDKVIPVIIDDDIHELFYNGCCNNTFWPLFHSLPDRARYSARSWNAYEVVNQIFSEKVEETLSKFKEEELADTILWIHDFHLMLAPHLIRKIARLKSWKIKVAFFLHVPFPPWDLFRLFPWNDVVLQGLLGCHLIGFHTEDYSKNFINCCQRILGCTVDYSMQLIEFGGRTIRVKTLPIGIPYESFEKLSKSPKKILTEDKRIILGVDRLDYTKGLPERMEAFKLFLTTYPQYIEKVMLLQIAVPTRIDVKEYQLLKQQINELIGSINGELATANWSPIRYIFGTKSHEELAIIYRDSEVAFITPLRDGMNLVAKEYIACQTESPGVLIISAFAGAAETMKEALVCNPLEPLHVAKTIHRALTMTENERVIRMNLLKKREKIRSVDFWMRSFLAEMNLVDPARQDPSNSLHLDPLTEELLDDLYATKEEWQLNPDLALLIDYDGTLAPITKKPELAVLPDDTRQLLERFAQMPNVKLVIISGRGIENLMSMVNIKNIIYSGSHGQNIVYPNGDRDDEILLPEHIETSKKLKDELDKKVSVNGAWVEDKGVHLTYHYRGLPREEYLRLAAQAVDIIISFGFIPRRARMAVEAKPPVDWHKGTASLKILAKYFGRDWAHKISIFYIGDDQTDEDAMLVLKGMAHTFRIGIEELLRTHADRRLPIRENVMVLLKWLEKKYSAKLEAMK